MRTKNGIDTDTETVETPLGEYDDVRVLVHGVDRMHCPVCGSGVENLTRPPGDPETLFFACKFCLSETFVRLPIDLNGEPEPKI